MRLLSLEPCTVSRLGVCDTNVGSAALDETGQTGNGADRQGQTGRGRPAGQGDCRGFVRRSGTYGSRADIGLQPTHQITKDKKQTIYCLNADTGEVAWQVPIGPAYRERAGGDGASVHSRVVAFQGLAPTRSPNFMLQKKLKMKMS